MTDQEVGELWRKHKLPVVRQLIRKLVEERANSKCPDASMCYRRTAHLYDALSDFGIDPDSWPRSK